MNNNVFSFCTVGMGKSGVGTRPSVEMLLLRMTGNRLRLKISCKVT